ncbi:MAG TPA: DoxX family protein, partial [Hanamia sp.]|nr:DoxX family protein [Hanamia sp.]
MKKIFSINHTTKDVDIALLIIRIAIALLMLTHGIPKMAGLAETPVKFMDVFGMGAGISLSLAVFAEVICSVLVLVGLGTRLAVIPLI